MPRRLLDLFLALTLVACANIDTRSDFDPGVDFKAYSSFAMAPLPDKGPSHMPRYTRKRAERIWEQIAAELVARGLEHVEGPQADLVVSFTVDTASRTADEVTKIGDSGGLAGSSSETGDIFYDTGWNEGVYSQHYVQGRLMVDMRDPVRDRVVWQGWATADLFGDRDVSSKTKRAIRALLREFPPK